MTLYAVALLEFHALGRRSVTGRFDGGRLSSDASGVLLREVDKRICPATAATGRAGTSPSAVRLRSASSRDRARCRRYGRRARPCRGGIGVGKAKIDEDVAAAAFHSGVVGGFHDASLCGGGHGSAARRPAIGAGQVNPVFRGQAFRSDGTPRCLWPSCGKGIPRHGRPRHDSRPGGFRVPRTPCGGQSSSRAESTIRMSPSPIA